MGVAPGRGPRIVWRTREWTPRAPQAAAHTARREHQPSDAHQRAGSVTWTHSLAQPGVIWTLHSFASGSRWIECARGRAEFSRLRCWRAVASRAHHPSAGSAPRDARARARTNVSPVCGAWARPAPISAGRLHAECAATLRAPTRLGVRGPCQLPEQVPTRMLGTEDGAAGRRHALSQALLDSRASRAPPGNHRRPARVQDRRRMLQAQLAP